MSKLLSDYVLEGGINGRYFVRNRHSQEKEEYVTVYQIQGTTSIEKTIPNTFNIQMCY